MRRIWRKILAVMRGNWGLKLFSVVFAVGLWLFVNVGQKPVERDFKVPVELQNVPPNVLVTNRDVAQPELRLVGPPAVLSTIDSSHFKVVLDLDGAQPGTSTFRLGADYFNPPRGVKVTRISPSVIQLKLESVSERLLPVVVRFEGKPPFGYKVGEVRALPGEVKVRGPDRQVGRLRNVETEPIRLGNGADSSVIREVGLMPAGEMLSVEPRRVTVSVRLEEEWITKEFPEVTVKARNSVGRYALRPSKVFLRLKGPRRVLEEFQPGEGQVYLDLQGLGPGRHTIGLTMELPPQVDVAEQRPRRFQVTIGASGGG